MSDDKISDQVRAIAEEWDELVHRFEEYADRVCEASLEAGEVPIALDMVRQKRVALEGSAGAELPAPLADVQFDEVTVGNPEWTYWALGLPCLNLPADGIIEDEEAEDGEAAL
jgi:hypothetical protein